MRAERGMPAAKRLLDVTVGACALVALSPLLVAVSLAIWLPDFHAPFYVAPRVGRRGAIFRMVKFRSMSVAADRTGVDSTSADDRRITPVGAWVRRCKLDELPQLWNVLKGEMSLVGPRPQVAREVQLYTDVERGLLDARPGITDFASIVFADEGEILKGRPDPDLAYNQMIRPWKSRLGLLYVCRQSLLLDLQLIWLTALALVSRPRALAGLGRVLERLGADAMTVRVAGRAEPLVPYPPPGATDVVMTR